MQKGTLNTREYVGMLKELVERGDTVSMRIVGSSMSPFLIHNRDIIVFKAPDRKLKRGDMVFFQRDSGQYVMHRIYSEKKDGYYIIGDAQTELEGPVRPEQIFALVIKVKRKDKWLEPGDFWWEFFAKVWSSSIRLRKVFTKIYGAVRKLFRR